MQTKRGRETLTDAESRSEGAGEASPRVTEDLPATLVVVSIEYEGVNDLATPA